MFEFEFFNSQSKRKKIILRPLYNIFSPKPKLDIDFY